MHTKPTHLKFCSSGFKCSGPSTAIEKVIWAAIKKVYRRLV